MKALWSKIALIDRKGIIQNACVSGLWETN